MSKSMFPDYNLDSESTELFGDDPSSAKAEPPKNLDDLDFKPKAKAAEPPAPPEGETEVEAEPPAPAPNPEMQALQAQVARLTALLERQTAPAPTAAQTAEPRQEPFNPDEIDFVGDIDDTSFEEMLTSPAKLKEALNKGLRQAARLGYQRAVQEVETGLPDKVRGVVTDDQQKAAERNSTIEQATSSWKEANKDFLDQHAEAFYYLASRVDARGAWQYDRLREQFDELKDHILKIHGSSAPQAKPAARRTPPSVAPSGSRRPVATGKNNALDKLLGTEPSIGFLQ